MIELNINPLDTNGQPIAGAIITCYVLDKQWRECPMEPRIRQQPNFYRWDQPFGVATGTTGPFFVYAQVVAAGYNPGYVPMTPWDGVATLTIPLTLQSFKRPFTAAPRLWAGNMCGSHVPGAPAVDGGAADASLILSWFYDRYDVGWRAAIRGQWQRKGYTHVLLSWPDSRAAGQSPQQFKATCQELIADGFYPCVMLSSKDYDAPDVPSILNGLSDVLPLLVGLVPMFCIGWELSLWLTPTQVQQLIDVISPECLRQQGTLVYVHWQQKYLSFPQPDHDNASFWRPNVGKLTGVLAQKGIDDNDATFLDWIRDCLLRMAGNFNMPTDSGFGHPFDFVMFEISAMAQFNGTCSEAEGDRLGRLAINAPSESGPAGVVTVMGSGNGA